LNTVCIREEMSAKAALPYTQLAKNMYVCMYVCMHVRMDAPVNVYNYVCMQACVYVCM